MMYYLHDIIYGSEGMCVFIKMLCELGGMALVPKGIFVFIVPLCKISPVCLMYVSSNQSRLVYKFP